MSEGQSQKSHKYSNQLPQSSLLEIYETMNRIRKFEEAVADLITKDEIRCPCHLYIGQEAIATGVCRALNPNDVVFSTHRSHGHYIAKGGSIKSLMAELFGKATGCSHGHGGSMHLASPDIGLPGSSAIVAGTISLSIGAGLAFSLQKNSNVSTVFFGDGATNEGLFYESLNFAALKKLPVLFICENNMYSTHLPIRECLANTKIFEISKAFNIPSYRIDGNNVIEVFNTVNRCLKSIRKGNGPTFIECITYRWRGHVGANDDIEKGLRSHEELEAWIKKCPIKQYEKYLFERKTLSDSVKDSIFEKIESEIKQSLDFAKISPNPKSDFKNILPHAYKETR